MKKIILGIFIGIILAHLYIASTNHPIKTIEYAIQREEECENFGGYRGFDWMFDYGLYAPSSCKCNAIHCDNDYANYLSNLEK